MFGSTTLALFVLVLTCAESGLIVYHNDLRHWSWWRSFFSTGINAIALFLFSIHYLIYKTSITGTFSYLLYFGYTFIITFLFFIATGKEDGWLYTGVCYNNNYADTAFGWLIHFYSVIILYPLSVYIHCTGTIGFLASLLYVHKIYPGPTSLLFSPSATHHLSKGPNETVTLPIIITRKIPIHQIDHDTSIGSTKHSSCS